jgi:hypothetical protein
MTTKETFSDQEWVTVQHAPFLAGAIVTLLDFGIVSSVREASAIVDTMDKMRAQHASDPLLKQVLSLADMPEIKKSDSFEQQVPALLEQIRCAIDAMRAKASQTEVAAYSAVVYQVAEATASASGGGWFGTGDKVSDKEKAYLADLKRILEG